MHTENNSVLQIHGSATLASFPGHLGPAAGNKASATPHTVDNILVPVTHTIHIGQHPLSPLFSVHFSKYPEEEIKTTSVINNDAEFHQERIMRK